MNPTRLAISCTAAVVLPSIAAATLPTAQVAEHYFGPDAEWFQKNIPFFDCADKQIEEIYYYRWKSYKAHIRNLGPKGYLITEFLDDVGWQKQPYAMLNDATGFHIYEGRWLRDRKVIDGFIDFLYPGGGNDRHFSESIADATLAYATAKGDLKWATQYLGAMRHIYNLWDDHYDFSKGLYFIEPLLDATEYTISSIDASDGKDGFRGGDAFRPTINSYMAANAEAIAKLSAVAGDEQTARDYASRAEALKRRMQEALWNDALTHFTDRYQVNNSHVHYWDFIRGRELAGYVPWVYNLPPDEPKFNAAWNHLLSPQEFAGPFGLRTVGPAYPYFMHQYRYLGSQPECQWNGPSWPFQTTQALLGMANLLNNYHQETVTRADYLRLLHQYAAQHYLNGKPNLQEDYDADTGKPIVGLDRSHHYNHSGFADLVITGLVGIHPRTDDMLEVNPLVPTDGSLPYFRLENVPYHGRNVTVLWDADGAHYKKGTGLSVFVDGKRRFGPAPLTRALIPIGKPKLEKAASPLNLAVNVYRHGFPEPSASSDPDHTLWQAVDGRSWFFPEMVRGWTPDPHEAEPWFSIDFGQPRAVKNLNLSLYEDHTKWFVPSSVTVEAWNGQTWQPIGTSANLRGNTGNPIAVTPTQTNKIRVRFTTQKPMRLVECEVY